MAKQKVDKSEWKVRPLLGWFFGLMVGLAAFVTVGATILFPIFYSAMHGAFSSDATAALVLLVSFAAVAGACIWLAYRVKRAVTQDVPAEGFADRAAGLIVVAGVALLFGLASFLLTDPEPPQVRDVLPASD